MAHHDGSNPDLRGREYDSRLDHFRVKHGIGVNEWAREAGLRRTAFNKQRMPEANPRAASVAQLVRGAARILRRPVKASELFDYGEDEPLGPRQVFANESKPWARLRSQLNSRLGRTMARVGINSVELQTLSGVTKTSISRITNERASPRRSMVKSLVVAFRRAGYDIHASDVVDLGDSDARSYVRVKGRPHVRQSR